MTHNDPNPGHLVFNSRVLNFWPKFRSEKSGPALEVVHLKKSQIHNAIFPSGHSCAAYGEKVKPLVGWLVTFHPNNAISMASKA